MLAQDKMDPCPCRDGSHTLLSHFGSGSGYEHMPAGFRYLDTGSVD